MADTDDQGELGIDDNSRQAAGYDATVLGHVAFVRKYAIELRALAHAAPNIAAKLRQVAAHLDADADQLEKIALANKLIPGRVNLIAMRVRRDARIVSAASSNSTRMCLTASSSEGSSNHLSSMIMS